MQTQHKESIEHPVRSGSRMKDRIDLVLSLETITGTLCFRARAQIGYHIVSTFEISVKVIPVDQRCALHLS